MEHLSLFEKVTVEIQVNGGKTIFEEIEIKSKPFKKNTSNAVRTTVYMLYADRLVKRLAKSLENILTDLKGQYVSRIDLKKDGKSISSFRYQSFVKKDDLNVHLGEQGVIHLLKQKTERDMEDIVLTMSDDVRKTIFRTDI